MFLSSARLFCGEICYLRLFFCCKSLNFPNRNSSLTFAVIRSEIFTFSYPTSKKTHHTGSTQDEAQNENKQTWPTPTLTHPIKPKTVAHSDQSIPMLTTKEAPRYTTGLLLLLLVMSISSHGPTPLDSLNDDPDSRYPCGARDRSVTWDQRGAACESCGQWFHAECQHIDSGSYDLLGRSNVTWHCVVCANANYSTIAFDLHGIALDTIHPSQGSEIISPNNLKASISSPFNPLHTSTPSRASKQDKHSRRPLRFLNVNCYSIVGKVAEFSNLLQATRPDIIVGTKSWLTKSHTDAEIFPRGFTVYRRDRPPGEWDKDTEGGGGYFYPRLREPDIP